jgi:type 1 glutamine amidotransferase
MDGKAGRPLRVLVFHSAVGFVHLSIPDAVEAIIGLGAEHGFEVDTTDDPVRFTGEVLDRYDVLVFVHTSGNVLPEADQRAALEGYMSAGGGFFGIHAASSLGPEVAADWPWFRDLIGAAFKGHTVAKLYCDDPIDEFPGVTYAGTLSAAPDDAEWPTDAIASTAWEAATVNVERPSSPAIGDIRDGDVLADEWYGFDENPRPYVEVVATVDESTYEPYLGEMGADHPIVWWRDFGGGRSVYNSMGHRADSWRDPVFLSTVVGGIRLAAGRV